MKLDVWKDAMTSGYPKAAINVANMRNVNLSNMLKNKKEREEKKLSPQQPFKKGVAAGKLFAPYLLLFDVSTARTILNIPTNASNPKKLYSGTGFGITHGPAPA